MGLTSILNSHWTFVDFVSMCQTAWKMWENPNPEDQNNNLPFWGCRCCATFTQPSCWHRANFGPDLLGVGATFLQHQFSLIYLFSRKYESLKNCHSSVRRNGPLCANVSWNDCKMSFSGTYTDKKVLLCWDWVFKDVEKSAWRLHLHAARWESCKVECLDIHSKYLESFKTLNIKKNTKSIMKTALTKTLLS